MKHPHQTRRDNPHHSGMPSTGTHHDHGKIFIFLHQALSFGKNLLIQLLSDSVELLQVISQLHRLTLALGSQHRQGLLGLIHATGGIETRPDSKTNIRTTQPPHHSGQLQQSLHSRPVGFLQQTQAMTNQQTVFVNQRNNVRNRGHRHQIEDLFQIKTWKRPLFQQRMSQLKNDSGRTKIFPLILH